jgi:hypothetical protein
VVARFRLPAHRPVNVNAFFRPVEGVFERGVEILMAAAGEDVLLL